MGQHGPSFVWNMEDISMAFLALVILKGGIGLLTIFFVVIFIQNKDMHEQIFDAVRRFGVEEVNGVVGGGEMTIHTVCHKPLGVIDVG
jgi:hypothetical protein